MSVELVIGCIILAGMVAMLGWYIRLHNRHYDPHHDDEMAKFWWEGRDD